MTEAEFQSHRNLMALDPDPTVKIAHLLRLGVPAMMAAANGLGAKFRVTADQLDPWEAEKSGRSAAKRVQLFAELVFGFPAGA